jgi:hypothetical protein
MKSKNSLLTDSITIAAEKGKTEITPSQQSGKIPDYIGKGEDAKNSLAYLVLKGIFILSILLTVLIFINCVIFRRNEKVPDIMSDIKLSFDIIIPIVTLVLGYIFGKSSEK